MNKKVDSWVGCYPSNWKGLITDESFAHPAKYSNKLIRRIYEHMFSEGWLKPGMTVVDPFGGVALGAFDACRLGLNWRGVELEPRFVWWGNDNIRLWNKKFSGMPRWSTDAVLLRGDSRFLAQVLSEAQGCVSSPPYETGGHHKHQVDAHNTNGRGQGMTKENSGYGAGDDMGANAVVSSPPYADGSQHTGGDDKHPERIQGGEYFGVGLNGVVSSPPYAGMEIEKNAPSIDLEKLYKVYKKGGGGQSYEAFCKTQLKHSAGYQAISSPPYADSINSENGIDTTKIRGKDKHVGKNSQANQLTRYGLESAQLGAMKATDKGFDAAVSSPPFQGNSGGTNVTAKSGVLADGRLLKRHAAGNSEAGYGESEGNLGSLTPSESGFNAAISSPPYEGAIGNRQHEGDQQKYLARQQKYNDAHPEYKRPPATSMSYGSEAGQLATEYGNDFWLSARTIIEQVYMVLEPGAHAVWVVKNYVKNKQIVPFCEQWQQMCEAVGFVTLHEHHAMLVRSNGKSIDLEGNVREHIVESKSFFRRIAEKKGSPKIDFETVLCMEKPNEVA